MAHFLPTIPKFYKKNKMFFKSWKSQFLKNLNFGNVNFENLNFLKNLNFFKNLNYWKISLFWRISFFWRISIFEKSHFFWNGKSGKSIWDWLKKSQISFFFQNYEIPKIIEKFQKVASQNVFKFSRNFQKTSSSNAKNFRIFIFLRFSVFEINIKANFCNSGQKDSGFQNLD